MLAYLARRVLVVIPIVLGIAIAAFLLLHLSGEDPARIALGSHATPAAVASLRHQLGIDRPLLAQLGSFIKGAITGNFGFSIGFHAPVSQVVGPRIVPTLLLVTLGAVISLVIAIPLGVVSGLRPNGVLDHGIRSLTTITFAMPAFWVSLVLIEIFSIRLGWFPTSGYGTSFGQHVRGLVLPALAIGLYLAPMLLRNLRASVNEVERSEFVESAVARGLSPMRVTARYVLRNSLIGLITVFGANVGFLLSGTVVLEKVFAIPGLGSLLVNGVQARDFNLVQAVVLIFATAVVLINLLTDLSYAIADPRVKL